MSDTFVVTIKTGSNAAFVDAPREELGDILRKLANRLQDDPYGSVDELDNVKLFDVNGNSVGKVHVL